MAFHVRVESGHRHAAVLNLDADRLDREVVRPWLSGAPVELGDREWEPAESELTIVEGPELEGPDLALGRGWDNARRSGRAVTEEVLAGVAPRVAVLAEAREDVDLIGHALVGRGVEVVSWGEVRRAIVGGDSDALQGTVVVVAVREGGPGAAALFDAGLAAGALRGRVLVACLEGASVPSALGDLVALPLDTADADSVRSLVARLG